VTASAAVTHKITLNPCVFVYVNDAAQTIRPRLHSDAGVRFNQVNIDESAPLSASISELRQVLLLTHQSLNPEIGTAVDVFCTAPSPSSLFWFFEVLARATECFRGADVQIEAHCFAAPAKEETCLWVDLFKRVHSAQFIAGGGMFLLTRTFRGVTVDRLRSYPVLSELMRTIAFTEKGRSPSDHDFSKWRSRADFGLYLTALESYTCQDTRGLAEYLLDRAIWAHLYPAFSHEVRQGLNSFRGICSSGSFEANLMNCSENTNGIAEAAERMMGNSEMQEQGIRIRRALAEQLNAVAPQSPINHAFERCYPALEDEDLRKVVAASALTIVKEFPIPVHPYLVAAPGILWETLTRARSHNFEAVRSQLFRCFRRWALSSHRAWMRPNDPAVARAQSLVHELGGVRNAEGSFPTHVYSSTHLDPLVRGDEREEVCVGPEHIQIIHILPFV